MEAYPQMAAQAHANNRNHQVPPGYKYSFASEALYQTVLDLLLSPEALRSFKNNPQAFLDGREGLTTEERRKLLLEHHGVTRMMFKRDPQQEAVRFVGAALLDSQLAVGYRDYQEAIKHEFEGGEIFPADYEGITLTAVTAMAISTAETIEITSFNANPWHPDRPPQLRPPHS